MIFVKNREFFSPISWLITHGNAAVPSAFDIAASLQ